MGWCRVTADGRRARLKRAEQSRSPVATGSAYRFIPSGEQQAAFYRCRPCADSRSDPAYRRPRRNDLWRRALYCDDALRGGARRGGGWFKIYSLIMGSSKSVKGISFGSRPGLDGLTEWIPPAEVFEGPIFCACGALDVTFFSEAGVPPQSPPLATRRPSSGRGVLVFVRFVTVENAAGRHSALVKTPAVDRSFGE